MHARLIENIQAVLGERTEVKSFTSIKAFDKNSFEIGHDLWRGHSFLKKIVLGRGLAGIASELVEHPTCFVSKLNITGEHFDRVFNFSYDLFIKRND